MSECVCVQFLFAPAHPSVKRVPAWSCTGEQSALAVSHYSLMVLVGLQGAHTCSERHNQYSCELLASPPGHTSYPRKVAWYTLSAHAFNYPTKVGYL